MTLRIMPFLHSFEPGGVERVALRLASAWAQDGADIRLVLGRRDGAMAVDAPPLDYLVLSSGSVSTARFETFWMMLCLWRQIRRERPDVLFCAGNTYAVVAVVLKLLLGRRCPPVVAKVSNDLVRRDLLWPARIGYRLWCRIQGRAIDHFVGMAEPMRAEIAGAMAVPPDRVSIIPDPALTAHDLAAFAATRDRRALGRAGPGRRFVAAGRLVAQKNFALAIRAFAAGAAPADRLVIVGDGPERAALEALVGRLGLGSRVSLPGHAPSLVEWFAASDIFLLSSDYEGVPAVILEALAAGLPIIATDCSVSMAALLHRGRLGMLAPVGDASALAAAIASAGSCHDAVISAREEAARFTVERSAGVYLECLAATAQRGGLISRGPMRKLERGAV